MRSVALRKAGRSPLIFRQRNVVCLPHSSNSNLSLLLVCCLLPVAVDANGDLFLIDQLHFEWLSIDIPYYAPTLVALKKIDASKL